MYWVIGGDQKEYGPVTAEQVRQWIRENRLNKASRIRADGSTELRPLGDLPEFAGVFTQPPLPPIAPLPIPLYVPGGEFGRAALLRDYRLDVVGLLERAWELFKRDPWTLIAGDSLIILLLIGLHFIPVLGNVAGIVLFGPFVGGLCWLSLKLARGENLNVTDVFEGFGDKVGSLILAGLITIVGVTIGCLLCLLPGIILSVLWTFPFLLIIDRALPAWDALELSRKIVQKHFFEVLALVLVIWLIVHAGIFALLVGVFVAAPVVINMVVLAYEDIFYPKPPVSTTSIVTPVTPAPTPVV
jgi:uncharacterized membrane protein